MTSPHATVDRERVASLLRSGRELMGDPQRWTEAARVLGEAMRAARTLDDELADAHASLALGELSLLRGELDAAPDYLRWAARIYEAGGHVRGAARAFYGLGEVARGNGDLDVARVQHGRALHLFSQSGDEGARAETALRLGEIAVEVRDEAEAMRHYREALDASEPGSFASGLASFAIGRLCLDARDPHTALGHLERAVQVFATEADGLREARARRLRARALVETGDHTGAVAELEAALGLLDGMDAGREELDARYDLSIALREAGRLEEALEHFAEALAGYEEIRVPQEGP